MGKYEWKELPEPNYSEIAEGDVRQVVLPVKAIFEWSDEIVDEVDEETGDITYTSGWIMKVLPETFVYSNHETLFLFHANKIKK